MNDPPVTPYIWQYQPQTGAAAGARQDYGAVVNWISSDPRLYARVQNTNALRNRIDERRQPWCDDGTYADFNRWTSGELWQPRGTAPVLPPQYPSLGTMLDQTFTSEGTQLAGSGTGPPNDGREYRKLTRDALPFPHNWQVKGSDGVWRPVMKGGAANSLTSYPQLLYPTPDLLRYRRPGAQMQGGGGLESVTSDRVAFLLTEGSSVPRSEGMTPHQFVQDFPPVVYQDPFSGSMRNFPKEFDPLFDPSRAMFPTNLTTLGYRQ
ncbi:pVIII [Bearded dragon adenovirus 1]|uniref:Pre-hexon-linking protein VIII n=1 Tax=Bearded dragon adenovirus 1 TaxID=2729647 RepID=A0A6M4MJB1_9ADEN|nr:pVIII [Bearded dragon adenovirus 1]QJR83102.1 pVIII [Bearded dragon adenovirus 1]